MLLLLLLLLLLMVVVVEVVVVVMMVMIMIERVMLAIAMDRVIRGLMSGRVGAVRRAVGRRAVGIRGTDRAAGNVTLVEVRRLVVVLLTQQLLQESRVLIPDVRRHGRDGTRGGIVAIVGTVMVRQKLAYSVHFSGCARRDDTTHVSGNNWCIVAAYGRSILRSMFIESSNRRIVESAESHVGNDSSRRCEPIWQRKANLGLFGRFDVIRDCFVLVTRLAFLRSLFVSFVKRSLSPRFRFLVPDSSVAKKLANQLDSFDSSDRKGNAKRDECSTDRSQMKHEYDASATDSNARVRTKRIRVGSRAT